MQYGNQHRYRMKEGILMKTTVSTKKMVVFALFAAITFLLGLTPLGLISLPVIKATTTHIPVIVGSIVLGPWFGAALGLIFGLTSLIQNSFMAPGVSSFVFSPFIQPGILSSIVVCFVPRALIGIISGFVFRLLSKIHKLDVKLITILTGIIGSLTNTVFVMGFIYILFAEEYAAAQNVAVDVLFTFIMGIVASNGVPEAIVAAIITSAIAIPVLKYLKKNPL